MGIGAEQMARGDQFDFCGVTVSAQKVLEVEVATYPDTTFVTGRVKYGT